MQKLMRWKTTGGNLACCHPNFCNSFSLLWRWKIVSIPTLSNVLFHLSLEIFFFDGCEISLEEWKHDTVLIFFIFFIYAVSAFTEYIKGLSPSTLDVELRMLQIIDDDDDQQEPDKRPELFMIELLLDYFIHEISCRNDFEFIQAVIRLFLKV